MSRFYVTTPIYYVNDAPHIGHAYTTLIGDAVSRWHRLLGDEVFYLTGTDEHGLKVQQSAEALGLDPRTMADRTSERFKEAWKLLEISYDDFIRTTEARHYAAVEQLLQTVRQTVDRAPSAATDAHVADVVERSIAPAHVQWPLHADRSDDSSTPSWS